MAERSVIQTLGFKQPDDCLKVILPFLKTLLPGKDLEKTHMNPLVQWGEQGPAVQVIESLIISEALNKMFQNMYLEASDATTLCHEPGVEVRAAIQFQALKKLVSETVSDSAQLLQGMGGDTQICGSEHLQGVDLASIQIKRYSIRFSPHPALSGLIDEAADLAEAPAQFPSGIVRDVP
ncbi:hypothetical protein [Microvirga sp. VF16]|uniref:hypothetical protein n=1 Tax=Microvirga sp. VF16 TaxID=2807101 RepID=UPI00353007AC